MADGHLTSAPNPATQYALTLGAILERHRQMIYRLTILLVGLTAIACTTDKKVVVTSDKVIETIKTDNELFSEIILTADTLIENGSFNKVIFKNGDKTIFEIYDEDAYDTIESKAIEIANEVTSDKLLLQTFGDTYYISLFGAQYGCCPRDLTVLQADKDGVKKIFKDALEVERISKTTTGEIKYFGIDSYSEALYPIDSLDILLYSYNPTWVYNLTDGFKFDSLATRQYNEDNYVFAGYKYDGEIKVAFPKNGQDRKSGKRKPYIYNE